MNAFASVTSCEELLALAVSPTAVNQALKYAYMGCSPAGMLGAVPDDAPVANEIDEPCTQSPDTAHVDTKIFMGAVATTTSVNFDFKE